MLCRKLNLFGGELVAIDGSKFKAVNRKERNYNEKKLRELMGNIDAKVETYLKELDEGDEDDPSESGKLSREELQAKIAQLQERQEDYTKLSAGTIQCKATLDLTPALSSEERENLMQRWEVFTVSWLMARADGRFPLLGGEG